MFNNNINKPAITVFLPLTSAKTIFAGTVFSAEKNGFHRSLAKTCQPCPKYFLMDPQPKLDIHFSLFYHKTSQTWSKTEQVLKLLMAL